jgi:tripartite-type tricarboxylate transporter receptor subunit TctC
MFDNLFASMQNIRAGKIRALAVGSAQAMASLPGVPSFSESGMPGFEVATWTILVAPAGTPSTVVDRLARETAAIFQLPEVRQRLQDQGALPVTTPPEQTERFVREEIRKWTEVVERAGVPRAG